MLINVGKENENTNESIVETKSKTNKNCEKPPKISPKKKPATKKVVKARRKLNLAAEDTYMLKLSWIPTSLHGIQSLVLDIRSSPGVCLQNHQCCVITSVVCN